MDIEHSLLWHDPGRFNGYVLSQHFAGTPVDPANLRDALRAVKECAASPALAAPRSARWNEEMDERSAGATARLGAKWPFEVFPLVSAGCARIPILARSINAPHRGLIH